MKRFIKCYLYWRRNTDQLKLFPSSTDLVENHQVNYIRNKSLSPQCQTAAYVFQNTYSYRLLIVKEYCQKTHPWAISQHKIFQGVSGDAQGIKTGRSPSKKAKNNSISNVIFNIKCHIQFLSFRFASLSKLLNYYLRFSLCRKCPKNVQTEFPDQTIVDRQRKGQS